MRRTWLAALLASVSGPALAVPQGTVTTQPVQIGTFVGSAFDGAAGAAAAAKAGTAVQTNLLGFAPGNVPNLTAYKGSAYPGWPMSPRMYFYVPTPSAGDYFNFAVDRDLTSFSGGSGASNINIAAQFTTEKGANDNTQEFALVAKCTTYSTYTGSCVGAYNQGIRMSGSIDPVWGNIPEVYDETGTASTGKQGTIAVEMDMHVDGADNAANGNMVTGTGNRVGEQVVGFPYTSGQTAAAEISNAFWIAANSSSSNLFFDSLYGASKNVQAYVGLDMRGVKAPTGTANPVLAAALASGQVIDFAAANTLGAAPVDFLSYVAADSALEASIGGKVFKWSSYGSATIPGAAGIGGAPNSGVELNVAGSNTIGLDMSNGTWSSNIAMRLKNGMRIGWEGTSTITTGRDTTTNFLTDYNGTTAERTLDPATGNEVLAGGLTLAGTITSGALDAITPATITAPASGSAPSGATQFTKRISRVTTCSTTQPMQLPAGAAVGTSLDYVLLNRSGGACTVYPVATGQIENGGANVPVTVASGTDATFRSMSPTAWYQ